MAKRMPQFVYHERTRHGRWVWYFRRGKGPRIRLPDAFGSPEFEEAYRSALLDMKIPKRQRAGVGSLAWLIARYRESSSYLRLSMATRRQRDNIFQNVIKNAGDGVTFKEITRKKIMDGRDARVATPAQARNFLDAMRGLFAWAVAAEHLEVDPTAGVTNPPRPKNSGFAAWTDDDVAAFECRWAAGTKERVWLHVLLYTGLRRGDAVRLGRQHVRDGVAMIRTEKTGTEVPITILSPLAETLAAGPTGDLAFIVGADRKPLTKETFGNYFREACNAAGVKKSAHGLRKLAATKAAEAGGTVAELEAMFGWTGGTMASHYTKSANRKLLSASGSKKLYRLF